MKDLTQLIAQLSERQLSRKQFLTVVGGSFLGILGIFRVLQALNTPNLAQGSPVVYGEGEYGYTGKKHPVVSRERYNSKDVLG